MIFTSFFLISIDTIPVALQCSTQNLSFSPFVSDVFDPFINRRYERYPRTRRDQHQELTYRTNPVHKTKRQVMKIRGKLGEGKELTLHF